MLFLIYFTLGVISGFIVSRKGYNVWLSMLLGLFGIIGLIVAVVLPNRTNKEINH